MPVEAKPLFRPNVPHDMLHILRTSKNGAIFQANLKPLLPKEQGDCFELLTRYYFQLDPTYKTKLKHVWLVERDTAGNQTTPKTS